MSFNMYQCLENRNSILKLEGTVKKIRSNYIIVEVRNWGAEAKKPEVTELLVAC